VKFVLYKDRDGEWRWSLRAKNGRLIADSGEGYTAKRNAIAMCKRINNLIPRETAWNTIHA
jgi:uncharacterized protein YegP (UPF0339 family)